MAPSDVPPPSTGPAPRDGEERVRALLSRAVEEQVSEQKALTDALTGLQQRVEAVAVQLRLAASGEAVGGGLDRLGRQLQDVQGELAGRLGEVASTVTTHAAAGRAGDERLGALAAALQDARAALDAQREAVARLEPQVTGLQQLLDAVGRRLDERLQSAADEQAAAAVALADLRSRPVEEVAPRLELLLTAVRTLPQTTDLGAVVEDLVTALSARLDRLEGPLDDLRHRPAGDVLRPEVDALGSTVRDLPGRLDALSGTLGGLPDRGAVEGLLGDLPRRADVEGLLGDLAGRVEALLGDLPRRPDVQALLNDVARRADVDAATTPVVDALEALAVRPVAGPQDVDRAASSLHARLDALPDRDLLEGALADVARRGDLEGLLRALTERPTAAPDDVDRAAAALHDRLTGLEQRLAEAPDVAALLAPLPDRGALEALLREALTDLPRRQDLSAGTDGVVDRLATRLEALAARPALAPADLDAAVGSLRDRLDGLADSGGLDRAVQWLSQDVQQRLAGLPGRDDVAGAADRAAAPLDARLARLEERPAVAPQDLEAAVASVLDRLPQADDVLGRLGALEGRLGEVDGRLTGLPDAVQSAVRSVVESVVEQGLAGAVQSTRDDVAGLRGQVEGLESGVTDGLAGVVHGLTATTGRLLDGMPDDALLRRTAAGVDALTDALPRLEDGVAARIDGLVARLDTTDEGARQSTQELRRVAGAVAGLEQTVERAVDAAAAPAVASAGPAPATSLSGDDVERVAAAVLRQLGPVLVQGVAEAVRRELANALPVSTPVSGLASATPPVRSEPVAAEPVAAEPVAAEPVAAEPVAPEPVAPDPAPPAPVRAPRPPRPAVTTAVAPPVHRR